MFWNHALLAIGALPAASATVLTSGALELTLAPEAGTVAVDARFTLSSVWIGPLTCLSDSLVSHCSTAGTKIHYTMRQSTALLSRLYFGMLICVVLVCDERLNSGLKERWTHKALCFHPLFKTVTAAFSWAR